MKVFIYIELVEDIQKNYQQHPLILTEYFGETLLSPRQMVAELWLTNPFLQLAVDGVLELVVSRSES